MLYIYINLENKWEFKRDINKYLRWSNKWVKEVFLMTLMKPRSSI